MIGGVRSKRVFLLVVGGCTLALFLGIGWLMHQEKLDPDAFLEAVGLAEKPDSLLLFPATGGHAPFLPRSAADRRTGLINMLRSDNFQTSALLIPGGQRQDAIPVVLIHGLMSTPDMWSGVVRHLRRDREIQERYQFWFFYYPTGQPIPLSALQLRETLDEASSLGRLRQPAVLIGHSMGGIVARCQAVSLEPGAAEAILPGVSESPPDHMVRRALTFAARPDVGRLVFIATPHRGTDFAYRGISRLGHYLIRLPYWLDAEIAGFQEFFPQLGARRFPTSIVGLSPASGFLRVVDRAPLAVPAHSIIPLLEESDSPLAHDGIVPLWSSHLPCAASELRLRGGHGAFDSPESLAELHRILLLHPGLLPVNPLR
jgi:pimeloyl-ACP methyl ester carboxylesterase